MQRSTDRMFHRFYYIYGILLIAACLSRPSICLSQPPSPLLTTAIAHDEGWTSGSVVSTERFTAVDSAEHVVLFPKPYLPSTPVTKLPPNGGDIKGLFALDDSTILVVARFHVSVVDLSDVHSPKILAATQIDYISSCDVSAHGIFIATYHGLYSTSSMSWFTWSRGSDLELRRKVEFNRGVVEMTVADRFVVVALAGLDSHELISFGIADNHRLVAGDNWHTPFTLVQTLAPLGDRIVVTGSSPDMLGVLQLSATGEFTEQWMEEEREIGYTLATASGNGMVSRITRHQTPVPSLVEVRLWIGTIEDDGRIRWIDSTLLTHQSWGRDPIQPLQQRGSRITAITGRLCYEVEIVDSSLRVVSVLATGDECLDLDMVGNRILATTNHGLVEHRLSATGTLDTGRRFPLYREHVVWQSDDRFFAYDTIGVLAAIDSAGSVTVLDSIPIVRNSVSRKAVIHGRLVAIPLLDNGLVVLSTRADSLSVVHSDTISCNDLYWMGDTLLAVGEYSAVLRWAVSGDGSLTRIQDLPLPEPDNYSVAVVDGNLFVGNVYTTVEYELHDDTLSRLREWPAASTHVKWLDYYVGADDPSVYRVFNWQSGSGVESVSHYGDGRIVPFGRYLVSASGKKGLHVVGLATSDVEEATVGMLPVTIDVGIHPNPASDLAQLLITTDLEGDGAVTLYSVDGQLIFSRAIDFRRGANRVSVDLADIDFGTIIVVVRINGHAAVSKMIVVN